ncbi:unnamed protein product, partial [Mesorhabditis belari]|uniref:Uncharacterized protein n=1 Tax=Mesorhabditis belari TaxID=2138241 RepID=A0AAF3JAI9_9BILA
MKNRANDDQMMVDQSKENKKNKKNFGPLNMEQYKLPDGSLDGKEIFVWYAFYDRRNRSETLLDVVRRQMNPAEYPGVGALNLDHHGLGFPDEPWDYGKFRELNIVKKGHPFESSRPQKYIYQTEYAKLPWVHEMKNFFGNKKSQMLPTEQVIYLHMRNEMTNLEGTPRIYPDFQMFEFFHDDIGWVKSCKNKIKLTEEWTRDWIENSIVRNQLNAIMQASCVVDRYFQRHLVPAMRDTFGMSKENVRKFRQSYYKIVSRYHNDLNACVWAALGNDGYTQSYKPWMASRDTIMVQILTESAVLDSIRPLTKNYRQTITESFKFLRRNLSKPLFDLSTFLKKGTIYYVS